MPVPLIPQSNIDEIINRLRREFEPFGINISGTGASVDSQVGTEYAPLNHKHTGSDTPKVDFSQITLPAYGYIQSGQSAYNTGTGFYLGSDNGTHRFSIGNPAGNHLVWDGANLTITGILTATSGAIGGWTIDATSIFTGTEDHAGYTTNAGDLTIYSDGTDASIHAKNFYIDTSGNLVCQAGTIGGWSISSTALYHDGVADANSAGMALADYPFYAGKKYAGRATAPFKVEPSGKLTCTDIVATGVINAQSGYLSAGVYVDTVNGLLCESGGLNVGVAGHIRGGQTDYNTGTGFFLGYDTADYKLSIGDSTDTDKQLLWDGTDLIVNGTTLSLTAFFGDGEDSNETIDDAGTTNLTEDKFYNNLTITNNSTLNPNGYRVFVSGTTTIDSGSKFGRDGGDGGDGGNGGNGKNCRSDGAGGIAGTAGTAGATLGAGTIAGNVVSLAGGVGGVGGNGAVWNNNPGGAGAVGVEATGPGANSDPSINVLTAITCADDAGDGGHGGDAGAQNGGAGGVGASETAVGTATLAATRPNTYAFIAPLIDIGTIDKLLGAPGNGGSGGAAGGGGGAATDGGSGYYGAGGGGGAGSGGQGGNGGVTILIYSSYSGAGTITSAAGTKGTKGAIGIAGDNSGAGGGSQSAAGGGGGGGGGGNAANGGISLLISKIIVNNGTISSDGGDGGNGGDGGDGGNGQSIASVANGTLGTDGTNGVTGKIIELKI